MVINIINLKELYHKIMDIHKLKNGLIVSCQADKTDPLYGSGFMVALAKSAQIGGAVGIRANGANNIKAIKKAVNLPVIGIYKKKFIDSDVYITPTIKCAVAVIKAGADILALDATDRQRPGNLKLEKLVYFLKQNYSIPLMADVSTLEEGINAFNLGFDIVATTLAGYTPYSRKIKEPDFKLLKDLIKYLSIPVILEGRISTQKQALWAIKAGAYAVVIGSAITRPHLITENYVKSMVGECSRIH